MVEGGHRFGEKQMKQSDATIRKPWGWERCIYTSDAMAVWLLHIVPDRGTSLHRHDNKRTVLTVLKGKASVTANGKTFTPPVGGDIDIPAGTPHKTMASAPVGEPLSEDGIWVLETEWPNDKEDLTRLEDSYGRDSQYEGKASWVKKMAGALELSESPSQFLDWKLWIEGDKVKKRRVRCMRVSDWIFTRLAELGCTHVFGVVGGGCMHLSDSVGNTKGITYIACHHEQGAAMAAEGYARYSGKPGVIMVTSGPGGTNAITGVMAAWVDSIPMIVISGNVPKNQMVDDPALRQKGIQESAPVKYSESYTKWATVMGMPNCVLRHVNEAWNESQRGRPGPCWIDVPLDVQGAYVSADELMSDMAFHQRIPEPSQVDAITAEIHNAKRPVVICGKHVYPVREEFMRIVEKLELPVVCSWPGKDVMYQTHPNFIGCGGIMGDRASNFTVQNADLLLVLGNSLPIAQTGYNVDTFAREAKIIMVDVDMAVMRKAQPDIQVECNVVQFIKRLGEVI